MALSGLGSARLYLNYQEIFRWGYDTSDKKINSLRVSGERPLFLPSTRAVGLDSQTLLQEGNRRRQHEVYLVVRTAGVVEGHQPLHANDFEPPYCYEW